MKTMIKVNRREYDPELGSSWLLWAVDKNINQYPKEPSPVGKSMSDYLRIHSNWVQECIEIAGLDWSAFYYGPGKLFAKEPVVYVSGSRILFTQKCGYDV